MNPELGPCANCPIQQGFEQRLRGNNIYREMAIEEANFMISVTVNKSNPTVNDPDEPAFTTNSKSIERRLQSYDDDDHYVKTSMRLLKERCADGPDIKHKFFGKQLIHCASSIAEVYSKDYPKSSK